MLLTEKIAEEIAQLDPDNAQDYRANAAAYIRKLEELEARYIRILILSLQFLHDLFLNLLE